MTPAADNHEDDEVWNAVALASVSYQHEMLQLSWALSCGLERGMTFTDLCAASGLSEGFVTYLLSEFA
jgi:hypothetical protein